MAATVSLIQMLASGMTTSAGLPVASGLARFYQPGTLTPVTVYADISAASAITPPLVLTAGGTGIAYTQQPTRMIVKDSLDVTTLFDGNVNTTRAESDYVTSAAFNGGAETRLQTILDSVSTSFGGAAGFWKYKQASNATERNMTSVIADLGISVKSFGAVGNGVADDTAAVQATITYVQSLGGGIVYFPGGTYLTSSVLTISATDVALVGAGTVSIVKQSNATAGCVLFTGAAATNRISDLIITHSSTSTGKAIEATGIGSLFVDRVIAYGFYRTGMSTDGDATITNSRINADQANAAAVGFSGSGTSTLTAVNSTFSAYTGASIAGTAFQSVNSYFFGAIGNGLAITSGAGGRIGSGNRYISNGANHGISIGASVGEVSYGHGNSVSPDILDSRTAATAPVGYTFAVNGNFTPLPLQTRSIRANGTAGGITVTVNAISATGNGHDWRLYCINSSGGAVTWAFNAQYKLAGGAVPNPATGNMIILHLEYDPISSVVREIARSGVVAI